MTASGSGDELTHVDREGTARMVDVGAKPVTARRAVAEAVLRVAPATAERFAAGDLPKGDPTAVVRIAGIAAAKRTSELIPLCHPLALDHVEVDVTVDAESGAIRVVATVAAEARTGVEMEALVAASVAGLTAYDLVKAVQRDAVLEGVRVLSRSGGASGPWTAPSV